ncbi:hypothetical protein ACFFP0_24510 [Rhizobium puerariae]|uniref:Right-handed parallel beta-helix repeat-containing protein n=1 Tax=Rhizobium puerariae TaxID=1585791 RepID=A0ABV6AN24_9HYPH
MPDISEKFWTEQDERNTEQQPNGWPGGMPAYIDSVGRMMMAAVKRWWRRANPYYETSGTGDDYIVDPEVSYPRINEFEVLRLRIDRSNSTGTPTLTFGEWPTAQICKVASSGVIDLVPGDLVEGADHSFWHNGECFILSNPATLSSDIDGNLLHADQNLADVDDVVMARSNLGLGNSAVLDVGTASGTVAAGNDSRIIGAVQKTDFVLPGVSAWSSTNGFKWMKSIALADGANVLTITEAGRYQVYNPTNGFPGSANQSCYLEVEISSSGPDWRRLRMQFVGSSDDNVTWERKSNATTFLTYWKPLYGRAWRTPEDFGCLMDGTTDDSDRFESALRSGTPLLIPGDVRVTRKITASRTANGTLGWLIQGMNRCGRIILDGTAAGIEIDIGSVVLRDTAKVVMRDLNLMSNAAIPSVPAIRLQASETVGSGVTEQTAFLQNVHVKPTSDANYNIYGISLRNMRLSKLIACTVEGRRAGLVTGSRGFDYSGSNTVIPVESSFEHCISYFFETGYEASGAWEGMKWLNNDAIGCKVGYKATSTNVNIGDSLIIQNSQANVGYVGIWIEDCKNARIYDNQIIGNSGWGTDGTAFYGMYIRANQGQGQFTFMRDNNWNGEQIKASVTLCTGIDINGFSSGSLGSFCGPSVFVGLKVGENIGANVRSVQFSGQNQMFTTDALRTTAATAGVNTLTATPAAY